MKKLLMALGAVAVTIGAQAASINWSIEYAVDPNSGDDMGDGNSYYAFFFADSTTAGGSSATFLQTKAIEALQSGDTSFFSNAIGDAASFDYGEAVMRGVGNFNNSNTINAYAVILDAADASSATVAYVTSVASTSINSLGGADDIMFGDISAATGDISNWISLGSSPTPGPGPDPVPEPTSGLLMLLGMAGLALRRRNA